MIDAEDLLQRFLSYVRIDTQSDPHGAGTPSTKKQWDLIRLLERELKDLGLADVRVTEFGYVLATVPATSPKPGVPRLCFLAHVDTAPGCKANPTPIVHRSYDGEPIVLPDDPSQVLDPEKMPALKGKKGETLVTASGKTLLGADDKSGVAIVMAAVRHLLAHPEIPHGPIRVCFNPDEEIGRGTEKITLDELGADFAYTLDAENLGEVDYESFSADKATLKVKGVAAHPGWAKGVMVNALRLGSELVAALPMELSPERTDGREGFIHPTEMTGGPEEFTMRFILRDFELDGLAAKGKVLIELAAALSSLHPTAQVDVKIEKQYRNMRYWLEKDMRPVEFALEAVRRAGLTPTSEAIRGGTDGSRLTERGLPTPNLFTGFHNVHSPLEWVSLEDMCKAAEVVVRLAQLWEERS
ncbi:MAG: peptidase T [Planctomycetota bacterium]|nr:peptidase T [Planctomycetota bacterium]